MLAMLAMLFASNECQNFKIRDEKGEEPDAYFEKLYIHLINCVEQFLQFFVLFISTTVGRGNVKAGRVSENELPSVRL